MRTKRVFGGIPVLLLATGIVAWVSTTASAEGMGTKPPGIEGACRLGARDPAAAERVVSTAVRKTDVDLAECVRVSRDEAGEDQERCPGFISEALPGVIGQCSGAGGELRPVDVPEIWSLDVDADGEPEYLIDFTGNYYCDGAPSVLSCGSLGCPSLLYAKRDDAWKVLAYVSGEDVPGIEVLAAPAGAREGTLRGGCAGARPCGERTMYTWQGAGYEASAVEARGHRVDLAPGGLWTLMEDTPVLAAPAAGAKVLGRYASGTEVVLRGKARDAHAYRYISPCNSCESGFVPAGSLRKEGP